MLSPCSLCDAKCCKEHLITVTSFDVVRIADQIRKKPQDFAILAPAKLLNVDETTVLECYAENKKERCDYVLALKSHPCVFLDNKNNCCSIHEFAPLVCRCYPLNQKNKIISSARCNPISKLSFSIFGAGLDVASYSKQLSEYRGLVKKWNSKRGKKENCLKFLLERSILAVV